MESSLETSRVKIKQNRALAQFKIKLAMRGRLSIFGHEEKAGQQWNPSRYERKRSAHSGSFYRTADTSTLCFGGETDAQRSGSNFRANGRKQRRESAGSHADSRATIGDCASRRSRQVEKAVTTIVSLAVRDFIAVGCDSLATTSTELLAPHEVTSIYFDANGDLKLDTLGKPLLQRSSQIWEKAKRMPIDQLPSVTKLYDLAPLNACVLFAGASRVGNVTIAHIVDCSLRNLQSRRENRHTRFNGSQRGLKNL
jgi:hypothetical protein